MSERLPSHPPGSNLALLRVRLDDRVIFGPGKANLLQAIAETGSISAAGRRLRMSYKRAWTLVDALNSDFAEPLVASSRGGESGGGAELTRSGRVALAAYRSLEAAAEAAVGEDVSTLRSMLKDPAPSSAG